MTRPEQHTLTISIDDAVDIIEAGELLDFLAIWLKNAPPAVTTHLDHYLCPSTTHHILRNMTDLSTKLIGPPDPPTQPPNGPSD